jgi:ribokinase
LLVMEGVEPAPTSVVVVGSINVDLVVRVPHLPAPGQTVIGGEHWRAPGGKGGNQAAAAASLGAGVAIIAAVGEDDLGRDAIEDLRLRGVDVTGIRRLDGVPTGVALIMVDGDGENQIAVASGANTRLSAVDVQADVARRRPKVVLAAFETSDEAVLAAARGAAEAGAMFVLNPAPYREIPEEILAGVDLLTPNQHEAAALAGRAEEGSGSWAKLFDELSAVGLRKLVVTLGSRGAAIYAGGEATVVPAPAVDAVDATGAGDAFNGALAVSLAEGRATEEAVRRAVAAGSMATRARGARAGLPTQQELEAFLAERG